jgi:hypothetical protein
MGLGVSSLSSLIHKFKQMKSQNIKFESNKIILLGLKADLILNQNSVEYYQMVEQFIKENKCFYIETSIYYNDDYIYKEFTFNQIYHEAFFKEVLNTCPAVNIDEHEDDFNVNKKEPDSGEKYEFYDLNNSFNSDNFNQTKGKTVINNALSNVGNNIALSKENFIQFSERGMGKFTQSNIMTRNSSEKELRHVSFFRAGINVVLDYAINIVAISRFLPIEEKKNLEYGTVYYHNKTTARERRTSTIRTTDISLNRKVSYCYCF